MVPGMAPLVSVLMANYCGAAYLARALRSVLSQTHQNIELLLADDASTDESVAIARAIAATDSRLRLLPSDRNLGPAGSRNRALASAQGDWVAIVDSDDLLHPQRFARLLAAAEKRGADMIADDMVFFGDSPGSGGKTLLQPLALRAACDVDMLQMLRASGEDPRIPAFGYLKPMIRRQSLQDRFYDPSLRVGEDYDLYLRLMLDGARFTILPDPMYLYRRHGASISHRLSVPKVQAMLDAHNRLRLPASATPDTLRALKARGAGLERLLDFERLVAALKARNPAQALRIMLRRPTLIGPLYASTKAHFSGTPAAPKPTVGRMEQFQTPQQFIATLTLDVPAPGDPWDAPPSTQAAALSDLFSRPYASAEQSQNWFSGLVPEN